MLSFKAAGEDQTQCAEGTGNSVQKKKDMLNAAIEQYRKIPCVDEDSDPLLFWRGYDLPGSALEPLLPFAASIAAVPATEAICERRFKAGGQVLTSARLRLMGSRVESLLMTNYNAPRFGGIRGVDTMEESCAGGAAAGQEEPLCGTDLWGGVGAGPGEGGEGEGKGRGWGWVCAQMCAAHAVFVHICAPHIKPHAQHA
jgi:hypothetical protein